jgi:hypothetical protein
MRRREALVECVEHTYSGEGPRAGFQGQDRTLGRPSENHEPMMGSVSNNLRSCAAELERRLPHGAGRTTRERTAKGAAHGELNAWCY